MIFGFDDNELDTDLFELRRAGVNVPVEPQVFEVLRYLVEHRDRLVTKNDLLDNVWGDRFVSESALTSRIKDARRAVGDDGTRQRTIRTVHGRGYRFVAQVVERGVHEPPTGAVAPPGVLASRFTSATVPPPLELGRDAADRLDWPMMGRAAALRVLADTVSDDAGVGALITGGAGVGKTRLADELVGHLESSGVVVARASGHPEARGIPLAALAHILPIDVATATGPGGELDRGLVFHAARQALVDAAGGQRPVVVVDDVDQTDELSRALIASLVLSRSVVAVLTMRTDDGPTPFDHLVKDGHLRRIELEPLEPETVETLLHRVLGGPMVAESVEELVGSALGNPGVLRQLVESTIDAGTLAEHDGVWRLTGRLKATPTLRDVVADRLDDLRGEHQHAMELLAVAGRIGLDLLIKMVGDDALEELELGGLVTVRTSGRRTDVALAHPLFGEVVMEDLSEIRGRRLRRELADALEATGARRRDDGIRLVGWRLDGGGDLSLDLLLQAARLALLEGENDLAERLLRRASAAGGGAEAMRLTAELHFRRGETEQVEAVLSAIDLTELDETTRARAVRRRSGNLFYGLTRARDALAAADDGLAYLTDPVARSTIEGARAVVQTMAGDVRGALAATEDLDSRSTDPLVRFEFIRARSLALATAGRGAEALGLIDEGEAIYQQFADDLQRPGMTVLTFNRLTALIQLGRMDEARALLERQRSVRSDRNAEIWQAFAGARLELNCGNPAAAIQLTRGSARWSRAHGQWGAERWVLALLGMARLLRGDMARAEEDIERVRSLETPDGGLFTTDRMRAYGWLAMARDGLDAAFDVLLPAAHEAAARGAYALEVMALHDLVRFGATDRVADRLVELGGIVDGPLIDARVAQTVGVANADADSLTTAIDGFDALGSPLFAAEAAAQLTALHAAAGRSADALVAAARAQALRAKTDCPVVTPALAELDAFQRATGSPAGG